MSQWEYAMPHWEYEISYLMPTTAYYNHMGGSGWEIVSVVFMGVCEGWVTVFKRPNNWE